jgi:hypothetical protein
MARFTEGDPRINRNGAPTQQARVEMWFNEHPGGSVSACARELDITRKTAGKWMPESIRQNRLQIEQKRIQSKQRSKLKRIIDIIKE